MTATLKTRKACDSLLQSDLNTFPIWEFATDEESTPGRDETWVRPLNRRTVLLSSSTYAVAGKFFIGDSLQFKGVAWINPLAGGAEILGGSILYNRRYLNIPDKIELRYGTFDRTLNALADNLNVDPESIFPISVKLAVCLQGESTARCFILERPK